MSKTREKILATSRALFNEKGFSNVTIRMIAEEMGISSGNLNYHFSKREDILETLYFEMVEAFDARVRALPDTQFTMNRILGDITASMERMVEFRFIWTDLYNLLKLRTSIREHFEKVLIARTEGTRFMFSVLMQEGTLKQPEFEGEHERLIERMISFSNSWLYASILYTTNNVDQDYINKQAFILLSMLYPYLTQKGKEEFRALGV